MSWQAFATDQLAGDESWVALQDAWGDAYIRLADIVEPRLDARLSLTAAASAVGNWFTDSEWADLLEEAGVNDAVNDAVNDGIIAVAQDLNLIVDDETLTDPVNQQILLNILDAADYVQTALEYFHHHNADKGWTEAEWRTALREDPSSPLNPRRAERMAASQANTAINGGIHAGLGVCSTRVTAFADSPAPDGCPSISAVRWVTRRDERVRPAHAAADTDTVPLGQTFTVGGYTARFPGDPDLPIGLRINCRCTLAWVDGTEVRRVVGAVKQDLYARARELDIRGRSKMSKAELQSAILNELCLNGLAGGPDCPDLFDQMNRTALMTYARQEKIVGRWRMTKPELIERLRATMRGSDRIRAAQGFASRAELDVAQKLANRKRRIIGRLPAGEPSPRIPNSRTRRVSRETLFEEFGGPDRGFAPCVFCGLKLHPDPSKGMAVLVPTPIRPFARGGTAAAANMVPGCTACFQAAAALNAVALAASAPTPTPLASWRLFDFHLQGQHDQKSHGNRGSRTAPDGAEILDETAVDRDWAAREGNERLSGEGDCYPAAFRVMMDTMSAPDRDRYRLAHGVVTGQEELDGVRFDHAWVEKTTRFTDELSPEALDRLPPEQRAVMEQAEFTTVIDRSNGNDIELPAGLYYNVGEIDPGDVRRYTHDEMAKLAVSTGHYGPWDEEVDE